MRRFGVFFLVFLGVVIPTVLVLRRATDPAIEFPVAYGRQVGPLRCLAGQFELADDNFPKVWGRTRALILDTTPEAGVDGWFPVRKTDPNMPLSPAAWRVANADSIDVHYQRWPVGLLVRLSLHDSVQRGRLVMVDDAGRKWVPGGTWSFRLKACRAADTLAAI